MKKSQAEIDPSSSISGKNEKMLATLGKIWGETSKYCRTRTEEKWRLFGKRGGGFSAGQKRTAEGNMNILYLLYISGERATKLCRANQNLCRQFALTSSGHSRVNPIEWERWSTIYMSCASRGGDRAPLDFPASIPFQQIAAPYLFSRVLIVVAIFRGTSNFIAISLKDFGNDHNYFVVLFFYFVDGTCWDILNHPRSWCALQRA